MAKKVENNKSYESEREILYKILFEIRGMAIDLNRKVQQIEKRLDELETEKAHVPAPPPYMPLEDYEAVEYVEPEDECMDVYDWSKAALEKALARNNGNRKKAAQELGISDRTLYRRLKQYGLA